MKIYTKTGDDGTTALFGGKRVSKDNPIVNAYGTLDELTSSLGVVCAHLTPEDKQTITQIQKTLYQIMAAVAGAHDTLTALSREAALLEKQIDSITAQIPPLTHFILPQGPPPVGEIHLSRTICRRAERNLVGIQAEKKVVIYINRLSDYLFTLARWYGKGNEVVA